MWSVRYLALGLGHGLAHGALVFLVKNKPMLHSRHFTVFLQDCDDD